MKKFILSILFMCLCLGYNTIAQEDHVKDYDAYELAKEEDSHLSAAIPLLSKKYDCTIHGIELLDFSKNVLVYLKSVDESFESTWFSLDSNIVERGFQIALSAMENDQKVRVSLSKTNTFSTIKSFGLRRW